MSNLEFELQTAATNLEVMLEAQKGSGRRAITGTLKPRSAKLKQTYASRLSHTAKKARIEIIPLIDIMFFLLASFMMVSLSQAHMKGHESHSAHRPIGRNAVEERLHQRVSRSEMALYFDKEEINYEDVPRLLKSTNAESRSEGFCPR